MSETPGSSVDNSVTAVVINHATFDLTRIAVWSLRTAYPELPIVVVDSGSPDDSADRLGKLSNEILSMELICVDSNVHHGPGMDLAIREVDTGFILLFDSDCIAYRAGFVEQMLQQAESDDVYMVGQVVPVDEVGYAATAGATNTFSYVHPHCALVRRSTYLELPPFERHGAPCLKNETVAFERGFRLVDFQIDRFVFHPGRGTAGRHGYQLGFMSRIRHLRRRIGPRKDRLQ